MAYDADETPKTLSQDGETPTTRMQDAAQTQDYVRRLIDDDLKRVKVCAKVAGLVDGNPPYSHRRLREAGGADRANVNVGTARTYLDSGAGAFYDLSSQAPGFVAIETSHGTFEQRADWSRIMSMHADLLFANDTDFDNDMQLSQNEMTLYGRGPLFFENEHAVFPIAVEDTSLKLPTWTPSKLSRWEVAVLLYNYYPPELYAFIRSESAAKAVGWDVDFTKKVIANAMDVNEPEGTNAQDWMFYQNQLKSNSFQYNVSSKVCKVAHVFWKEFDGTTTHAIVEREATTGSSAPKVGSYFEKARGRGVQYLYLNRGRYNGFNQCIHPMYMDRGRGGYHHTITGLGVKMFSAMEFENRLYCNLMDKAFAPKVFFRPMNAESKEKMQITKFSDWGILPANVEAVQTPIQGFISDGLSMFHTSADLMRSNLSGYRQPVQQDKGGNPVTKFEKQAELSQQGELSNTTFNRYYRQLDVLYAEIARRMCNLNTTDPRAQKFQEMCQEDGVPRECFGRIRSVRAVRVVGRGSPFLRAQTTSDMMPVMARLPEDGQERLIDDYIASRGGQDCVRRYYPKPNKSQLPTDQKERALLQVGQMRQGIPAIVTGSQNPLTFCSTYIEAATASFGSLKQGANPQEVLSFMELCGQAIAKQLKRLQGDPLRATAFQELEKQFKRVAELTDKLKKMVEESAKKQQAQQQKTQAAMSDQQIKAYSAKGKMQLAAQKQQATLRMKSEAHRASLLTNAHRTKAEIAMSDARTAAEIHRNKLKAFSED